MIIIPWINGAAWRQEIPLSGRTYVIEAAWNPANERWTINLKDRNENLIVGAIKLIPGVSLLCQCNNPKLPPGVLLVTGHTMPNYESMGTDQQLVYIYPGELDAV